MPWMIMVILLTLLDTLSSEVACISLADIYWNVTNPIFRIDNTDHIIDVNKNSNTPFDYDQVNIICPVYPHSNPGTDEDQRKEEEEHYIIYNVSKEEYDSCRITNPNPRRIAVCDTPNQIKYFTITFRSFTPQPGGLEFIPGNDYYFVSTSSGDIAGIEQKVGGRCATHNMKVIFKVCCGAGKGSSSDGSSNHQISKSNVSLSTTVAAPTQQNNSKLSEAKPPRNKIFPGLPPVSQHVTSIPKWLRPTTSTNRLPMPPYHLRPYEVPIEDEMDRSPPVDKNKDEAEKTKKSSEERAELVNNSLRWTIHHGAYYFAISCLLYQLLVGQFYR